MNEIEKDIGTAMMRLRQAFTRHGIPMPDVLEYSDSRKAYEAMIPLRHAVGMANWVMDETGKPYAECMIAGVKLRFEARKIERPGTGEQLDDGIEGRIFRDDI